MQVARDQTEQVTALMRSMRNALMLLSLSAVIVTAGCGGGGGDGQSPGSTSYLPMAVGNTWDYTMTLAPDLIPAQNGQNQEFAYHETVIGTADLQGQAYYVIRTVREAGEGYEESTWQQYRRVDDEALYARVAVRSEEGIIQRWYDLPLLMLPPIEGQTWKDPEFEDVTFTTASVNETIQVPAGTFRCVQVDREFDDTPPGEDSPVHVLIRSYYARGVGLVRDETREDGVVTSTLELLTYELN
ncbi:MAG: hypothetical protein U9R79_15495 [Armatimonadota bacterium]|nr:hypothetical protein [Armatimonadota bacterium]